ncbi:MarR family transcriptional regulator [Streptomyces sp. NPDC006477]|uniref:MarR family transcriptional regulator n=1 Tax=Streptomyces sp. NPDC006477 TaxID=3364747 RepID=UPI003679A872
MVHLLRAVTVEFGLRQAEFAARNAMHHTDVRALICLLDAARAGEPATVGLLGARLGLNSAGTTSVIDRLERLGHVARVRDAGSGGHGAPRWFRRRAGLLGNPSAPRRSGSPGSEGLALLDTSTSVTRSVLVSHAWRAGEHG